MVYYIGSMPVTPYLEHHGILGMKWGVRRYQNPDGSLTAAGRARYGVGEGGEKEKYHFGDLTRNYTKKAKEYSIQRGKQLREKGYTKATVLLRPTKESTAYAIGSTAVKTLIATGVLAASPGSIPFAIASLGLQLLEGAAFSRLTTDLIALNNYDQSISEAEQEKERKKK